MVFTSVYFLLFLLATIILYFVFPIKIRWVVLLLASGFFYYVAGVQFVPFILVTTIISYLAGMYISGKKEKLAASLLDCKDDSDKTNELTKKCQKACKAVMIIALLVVIGILLYTKFFKMLAHVVDGAFSGANWSSLTVIVPLGISYYTFSTVGYVLDIYWERYSAQKNFFKYMLYVIYFPHILQGPIARYNKLGVQFFEEHRFDYKRMMDGFQLMMWGFIQKLVIADRLGIFVGKVYDNWENQTGLILLIATLFYAVQIYTDFAGCVNIARGASSIFGIELEDNFRQPYFSESVAEFWRRWHMTLGAWFKDYLCMPVAVSGFVKKLSKFNRKHISKQAGKNTVTICSLVAVWICTGVWHGTGLNYILWGIWQGGIIVFSTLMEPNFKKWKKALKIKEDSISWKRFKIVRTFILTGIIPRVVTRAASVPAAMGIFKRMVTTFKPWVLFDGTLYSFGLDRPNFWLGIICIFVLYFVSKAKENGVQIRDSIAAKPLPVRWIIYYAALFTIIILGIYGPGYDASAFVYMNF